MPCWQRLLEFRLNPFRGRECAWSVDSESFRELTESRGTNEGKRLNSPREMRDMPKYCYVYVLRSLADHQFYVGLTRDLRARLQSHNKGLVPSTKGRKPFELVYWEGCLNESYAGERDMYLKTAWGKRYIKTRLQR